VACPGDIVRRIGEQSAQTTNPACSFEWLSKSDGGAVGVGVDRCGLDGVLDHAQAEARVMFGRIGPASAIGDLDRDGSVAVRGGESGRCGGAGVADGVGEGLVRCEYEKVDGALVDAPLSQPSLKPEPGSLQSVG
jgi:hypothetical protein